MSAVAYLRARLDERGALLPLWITGEDAASIIAEIRDLCPDCVACEECGHEMCKHHEYGDVSECTHHNLCADCWPGDCRQCQDRAEADPDMWGDMAREGRGL